MIKYMTALLILLAAVVIGYIAWTSFTKTEPSNKVKLEPHNKRTEIFNTEAADELHPFENNKVIAVAEKIEADEIPFKHVDAFSDLSVEIPLSLEQQLAKILESEYTFQMNLFEDLKKQLAEFQTLMDQINTQLKVVKMLNTIATGFVNSPVIGQQERKHSQ